MLKIIFKKIKKYYFYIIFLKKTLKNNYFTLVLPYIRKV